MRRASLEQVIAPVRGFDAVVVDVRRVRSQLSRAGLGWWMKGKRVSVQVLGQSTGLTKLHGIGTISYD